MKLFAAHRKNLQKKLNDGLIFLTGAEAPVRNNDVHYEYRQTSDFLYLTGIEWDGYTILLDPKTQATHLFIPDFSIHYQVWDGVQLTKAQAKTRFGVNHVHYHSELADVLKTLKIQGKHKTLYALPSAQSFLKKLKKNPFNTNTKKLRENLDSLRLFKSAEEIALMQKANDISATAHAAIMRAVRPGMTERQLQAVFMQACLHGGARLQAYQPIFSAGRNAAVLHYRYNDAVLKDGDLICVDAGCEWMGYASDITRAFPINGKFSKTQAAIYDIVLNTQKTSINSARPGVTMAELHRASQETLAQGLQDLGIFKTCAISEIVESGAIRIFYPHGLGHMLGLDVHDVGGRPNPKINLRNTRLLEAGVCITIEPGLYFIQAHFENKDTRKKFAKTINWKKAEEYYDVGGIRIEDDLWITKDGNHNLTTVPKERSEIEAIMRS